MEQKQEKEKESLSVTDWIKKTPKQHLVLSGASMQKKARSARCVLRRSAKKTSPPDGTSLQKAKRLASRTFVPSVQEGDVTRYEFYMLVIVLAAFVIAGLHLAGKI